MAAMVLLVAAWPAGATPTFLTPVELSAAGQDGFEPDVAVDSSGNVIAVWTRSDGTNTRIQYATRTATSAWSAPLSISDPGQNASDSNVAIDPSGNALVAWSRSDGTNIRIQAAFRPAGGSFAAPVTVSDPGFDATKPEVDFDASGKALLTWQRFDGTKLRVQATTRSAGAGGTFANETTLSEGGQDAFEPRADAGPDVDANAAIVWTRSDGSKLRVQAARRRDVVGFPRPRGATPLRAALVPGYNSCSSPNRTHGPALAFGSCAPPVRSSSVLTVGTPDANTFAANSIGFVKLDVIAGDVNTTPDEADVAITLSISDVRNNPSGTDYTGRLGVTTSLRITDNANADERPEPATVQSIPLEFAVQCAATGDTTTGGLCTANTTYDALVPGAVQERMRAIWELSQIQVKDAGPNGTGYASCPPTCGDGDETVFMRQGVFVP
jgi:hypothetical protein